MSLISHKTQLRLLFIATGLLLAGMALPAAPARADGAEPAAELLAAYPSHPDFQVTVDGRPMHVWRGTVSTETMFHPRPYHNRTKEVGFVTFDLARPVEIEVRVTHPALKQVAIKPDRIGITPSVQGDTIRFRLERPANFIVELNGSAFDHLYIFANPPEKDAPSPGDPNVIYFGPGLHRTGLINVKQDGQTVYLAAGAVVRGRILVRDRHHVVLRGRGILDAIDEPDRANPVLIDRSSDVRIEDIVILNSRGWTVRLDDSRRLQIENIREICSHQNSDGIDPLNCEDVVIRNTFQRVYDDAIVIKTQRGGASRRILAEGCVLIGDHATPLKIGANEMMGTEVSDVTFRDCDILHSCATGYLAIKNQGTAAVSRVRFEDIRIEGSRVNFGGVQNGTRKQGIYLFLVFVKDTNVYARKKGEAFTPGSVRDVVFRNVTYRSGDADGGVYLSRIEGLNDQHRVSNVLFDHVIVNGQPLADGRAAGFETNAFADGIRFVPR